MVNAEEVKAYLSQAYYVSKRIRELWEIITTFQAKAMKDTVAWSETPKGGHTTSSPQAVWIERIIELKDDIEILKDKEQLIRDMLKLVSNERERIILQDYHLYRLGIRKMTVKYNYSDRQIYRILNKGYRDIAFKINEQPELEKAFRQNTSVNVSARDDNINTI